MQIGAMYRKMRILITSIFAAGLRQNELAMSVEEREFLGLNTVIFQGWLKAKRGQNANSVRHHVDADPQWFDFGGRFKYLARDAALVQR